ncbi:hypothetical protein VTK73DRAFT_3828 [Phialemonium thermophilum]|uniref:Uncharacterized protein n=1 Tax=Phialemonium thermophilum TaxID=223376 RepID=A0ABR3VEQ4_9PEZI
MSKRKCDEEQPAVRSINGPEGELISLKGQIHELQSALKAKNELLQKLTGEKEQLAAHNHHLSAHNHHLAAHNNHLLGHNHHLQQQLQKLAQANKQLASEKEQAEMTACSVEAVAEQFKSDLAAVTKKRKRADDQVEKLQLQLVSVTKERDEALHALNDPNGAVQTLQKQNQELAEEVKELGEEVAAYNYDEIKLKEKFEVVPGPEPDPGPVGQLRPG